VLEEAFRRAIGLVHQPWDIRNLFVPDVVVAPVVFIAHSLGIENRRLLTEIATLPFIALSLLTIVLVYRLTLQWTADARASIVAALLFALHWIPLGFGATVYPRTLATACIVAAALILMKFPSIQHLGTSLLASAGLAGLAAGIAARPVLANLIAGLQLALTEPIRIDDAVLVEGEFGHIEEITTTYVVVRIWDQRRLVTPLAYFIEHPFQNWTLNSADLLGTVMVHVDYRVPVEEVRQELQRIVQGTPLWDGRVWNLQVTDATDSRVELRAMVSAAGAGALWDLRVHVREKLIAFLQERHPQSLPRVRAEVTRGPRVEQATPATV